MKQLYIFIIAFIFFSGSYVTSFSHDRFVVQTILDVLPVKLVTFTAQSVSNDITLIWKTTNEVNDDYCEVERSMDGTTFNKVASVKGGNNTGLSNYQWVDANAALMNTAKLFYRLKIISASGVFQYSSIIIIPFLRLSAEIITGIVPNPFKEKLTINLHLPKSGQILIKLADITGRVYIKEKITASQGYSKHNLSGIDKLSPGIYFLTADFEGREFIYKIVK